MFNKKRHAWYWSAFMILLFCLALFTIAKFFMKAIAKFDRNGTRVANKRKDDGAPLFI